MFLQINYAYGTKKNPVYGRQSISQPMQIVAPIPKKCCYNGKICRKSNSLLHGDFKPFMIKSIQI